MLSLIDAAGWDDLCPLEDKKTTKQTKKQTKKQTVFIVLFGEDCEGSEICGVYAKKEDAIAYIDECIQEDFSGWIRKSPEEARSCYEYNGKIREGCMSIIVEEFNVK